MESLKKLQTEYIDLLLIHQPFGDYYGTYRAMERAYKEGKVKAIGVSNFYPDRFADLCHFVEIKPMVNQVETHVKSEYEETSVEEIQKQVNLLSKRIDNLYTDKLDGRVTQEFWKEKHNLWYKQKEELLQKLIYINNASKTFDEGSNLLENFCKYARQEYLRANAMSAHTSDDYLLHLR